ncbi:hypothetical protein T07_8390, partial [Trichinella nelsoni]
LLIPESLKHFTITSHSTSFHDWLIQRTASRTVMREENLYACHMFPHSPTDFEVSASGHPGPSAVRTTWTSLAKILTSRLTVPHSDDWAHHPGETGLRLTQVSTYEGFTVYWQVLRQVTAFDKSLSAINCSARPDIGRCMIFLLVRETKSTASCGPVSRRISARSFRMKKLCDAVNQLFELRSHWRSGVFCRTVEMQGITVSSPESCHRTSPNGAAVQPLKYNVAINGKKVSSRVTLSTSSIFQNSRKILPVASSIRVSNVRASSVNIIVVSTIGIQPIWTERLLDRQSKATVDDIKVVNKIHDRAHHDRFPL